MKKQNHFLTCPATANPSARRDVANQTCKQTWNAAIDADPCRAANDAERVTQNVTATTLINNKSPGGRVQNTKDVKTFWLKHKPNSWYLYFDAHSKETLGHRLCQRYSC